MDDKKKHQIILIRGPEVERDYSYNLAFIESVGQWDEVTDEELKILENSRHRYIYQIVIRNPKPDQPSLAHLRTPQDYIKQYREEQAVAAKRLSERQKKDEQTLLDRKRKRLEKLKKELGEA